MADHAERWKTKSLDVAPIVASVLRKPVPMNVLLDCLFVGIGGMTGALCRFGIAAACQSMLKTSFPIATLIANVTGCFLIGLLIGSDHDMRSRHLRTFFGIGFLGALTTFSTFGAETVTAASSGQTLTAAMNIIFNVALGLTAVVVGMTLGRTLVR